MNRGIVIQSVGEVNTIVYFYIVFLWIRDGGSLSASSVLNTKWSAAYCGPYKTVRGDFLILRVRVCFDLSQATRVKSRGMGMVKGEKTGNALDF